ncbi:hypothetical protein Cni_G25790 [Canna indica]|uniref:DWNN domain-containing protein n=1 Tax=Canna indica TaxID=4628 RepID=A0AAQ3L0N5_9LILI|nr:hypothetical protein Cni_G25790 [Canna indica]
MAVYYKFKSAKNYDSIPIEGQFISVANLKERIFQHKLLGKGTGFDLLISNAQSNEEYVDQGCMIPKNTSVVIRRVPGCPRKPIVIEQDKPTVIDDKVEDLPPSSGMLVDDSSATMHPEDYEGDDVFGNDPYAPSVINPAQTNIVSDVSNANKVDEDSKIKALVDTPAIDWNREALEAYGSGRGFGRGTGGRMMGGRSFGRGMLERKTPPAGYVCHRCKVAGHLIQHCPTNGDPNYDFKRLKPPTGIPKSMLMVAPDGSYALPSGAVAALTANEAAFDKEMEGLSSTCPVRNLPPEFHCPLCKELMKDAALTSKCCFKSFCYKCIRDQIIMKKMCTCGSKNLLIDDIIPNNAIRETINRALESMSSITESTGSLPHVNIESAQIVQPNVPPPTPAASEVESMKPTMDQSFHMNEVEIASESKVAKSGTNSLDKTASTNVNVNKATPECECKEPKSLYSTPVPGDVQEKEIAREQGNKKKKKPHLPSTAADMQWRGYQGMGAENFGIPWASSGYNLYGTGAFPLGMDGSFGAMMPYMGCGISPFNVPFGGRYFPQDPSAAHGFMMQGLPRDVSELRVGSLSMNQQPPSMNRQQFEARNSDLRRKHETKELSERERGNPQDRETRKELSSTKNVCSMKAKHRPVPSDWDRSRNSAAIINCNAPFRYSTRSTTPPRQRQTKTNITADRNDFLAADHSKANKMPSSSKKMPSSEPAPRKESNVRQKADSIRYQEGKRSRGRDYESREEHYFKRHSSSSSQHDHQQSHHTSKKRCLL